MVLKRAEHLYGSEKVQRFETIEDQCTDATRSDVSHGSGTQDGLSQTARSKRGIFCQHVGWTERALNLITSAIRAVVIELHLGAIGAEGALVGSDPRLGAFAALDPCHSIRNMVSAAARCFLSSDGTSVAHLLMAEMTVSSQNLPKCIQS